MLGSANPIRWASATPSCARGTWINNEPFAVLLPDDLIISTKPCLGQLLDVFDEFGKPVIAVQTVPKEAVAPIRHHHTGAK